MARMFGIGMPELLLIFVIALLVFGPAELPKIGRTIGRAMAELRRASDDLKEGIQREIDAAEREMTAPPPGPEPPAEPVETAADPTPPAAPAVNPGDPTPEPQVANGSAPAASPEPATPAAEAPAPPAAEATSDDGAPAPQSTAGEPAPQAPAEPKASSPSAPDRPAESRHV